MMVPGSRTSLEHLALIQKWKRHYDAAGCSQSKVFTLSRKSALKEMREINQQKKSQ